MNPMSAEPDHYQTYMLRLWRVQSRGMPQCHASLESPLTGERQSFADLEQLLAFLAERVLGERGDAGTRSCRVLPDRLSKSS